MHDELKILLHRFVENTLTKEELVHLRLLLQDESHCQLAGEYIQEILMDERPLPVAEHNVSQLFVELLQKSATPTEVPVKIVSRRVYWIAASAILLIALGSYFLINLNLFRPSDDNNGNDIAIADKQINLQALSFEARNGAILTLADGSQIILDSLGNGIVANEQGAEIELRDGQISYHSPLPTPNSPLTTPHSPLSYHTLTTPKGRHYTIKLPDGSMVWLNAASSIKYPAVFSGRERRVEITGEAYFEITPMFATDNSGRAGEKAQKLPFIVTTTKQTIEVLGTHFNVNAYEDEEVERTTLLEGSVKVSALPSSGSKVTAAHQSTVLKPGQQAVLNHQAQLTTHSKTDIDKVISWKNGVFNFNNASLEEVMRELERWYDIEVSYPEGIPEIKFGGEMSRDLSLPGLLRTLQKTRVRFQVEGRKLVVLP